jgi:hypothetical protein
MRTGWLRALGSKTGRLPRLNNNFLVFSVESTVKLVVLSEPIEPNTCISLLSWSDRDTTVPLKASS